jgi:hypothetical protein
MDRIRGRNNHLGLVETIGGLQEAGPPRGCNADSDGEQCPRDVKLYQITGQSQ